MKIFVSVGSSIIRNKLELLAGFHEQQFEGADIEAVLTAGRPDFEDLPMIVSSSHD